MMRHLFFDTETERFYPGYMAPVVVCLQYCFDTGAPVLLHGRADRAKIVELMRDALRDPDCMLVGHNVAYDLACLAAYEPDLLPLIFAAYEQNRVTDTMYRQKLADIARGRYRTRQYDLASCAEIHDYETTLDKKDPWRVRYGELQAVALHYWPASAVSYALNDATATRHVFKSQAARYAKAWICDEFNQARKFFCLRLMEVWGVRTDERGVEALRVGAMQEIENTRGLLVDYGLVSGKRDGTYKRNIKAVRERVKEAYARIGKPYPRPKQQKDKATGTLKPLSENPACDSDACSNADDYVLETYAKYSQMCKVLAADVPMLAAGCDYPIHTHFDIVESGRTSSASPNIQNPRRMAGVRECFVPRPGRIFIENDMSALELRTVAQVCKRLVGYSRLADVLNGGKDPHTALAAVMLGKSYEWVVDHLYEPEVNERRTGAKGMNFGFPGGLGAKSFPAFAWKAYKFRITEDEVAERKAEWLAAYPEFKDYHRLIGDTYESGVCHLFTNRLRGRVTFTSAANSYFQGLGADVCGGALWEVTKACYVTRSSPLYGSRPVNFMHDSILTETEPANTHDALAEQDRLMCEGGAPFLPDVPPKADGKAMTRWSKDAALIVSGGRAVPWSPLDRGESLEAYALRLGAASDAKGLGKSFEAQAKTHAKGDAKRIDEARRAAEFMAALAAEESEESEAA
jgi:hypothetical protein